MPDSSYDLWYINLRLCCHFSGMPSCSKHQLSAVKWNTVQIQRWRGWVQQKRPMSKCVSQTLPSWHGLTLSMYLLFFFFCVNNLLISIVLSYIRSGYSYKVAVALSLFLGWIGADRFYLGYPALGKKWPSLLLAKSNG